MSSDFKMRLEVPRRKSDLMNCLTLAFQTGNFARLEIQFLQGVWNTKTMKMNAFFWLETKLRKNVENKL